MRPWMKACHGGVGGWCCWAKGELAKPLQCDPWWGNPSMRRRNLERYRSEAGEEVKIWHVIANYMT